MHFLSPLDPFASIGEIRQGTSAPVEPVRTGSSSNIQPRHLDCVVNMDASCNATSFLFRVQDIHTYALIVGTGTQISTRCVSQLEWSVFLLFFVLLYFHLESASVARSMAAFPLFC